MNELEGSNTEFAETQQLATMKASLPAALKRWEQKIEENGLPKLMPTTHQQYEQFYCAGYCDAIYDMISGRVKVRSAKVDPAEKSRIVRL